MSQSAKKQTFLHGAALLAIATAIVKVIGALYKLPLKMVIGDQGYSYFCTAYDIYTVLLMVSTTGLPVAMSRMISQASSLGNYRQVRRVYQTAKAIFLGLGLASSLLMCLFCHQLANFQKQPDSWFAILCLGPCAFLMGILSTYRGFFQGQGNMIPTSVSQVMEAVCKLLVGLGAALLIAHYTNSIALAAGGAILGVTVSCVLSSGYLMACFRRAYGQMPKEGGSVYGFGTTVRQLLSIAVPITIGSAGLQIIIVLETNVYMSQLLTACGLSQATAETMKGIYNMAQTIYNMPIAFFAPITISIIPAITSQLVLMNHRGVRNTEESAARITGLLSLPCTAGLMLLSEPIMALLGGYQGEKLTMASQFLSLLSISVFLHAVVQLTNAIMQSHGHAQIPVTNMLLSGVLKLAVVYILTGNPAIGLLGVPISTAVYNLCNAILNLFAMRKCVPQKPAIVKNVLRALLPAAIMGAAAYGSYRGLKMLPSVGSSRVIACGVPILVGAAVYFVCAAALKSITREDCLLLPKGEKLAKLLHL